MKITKSQLKTITRQSTNGIKIGTLVIAEHLINENKQSFLNNKAK